MRRYATHMMQWPRQGINSDSSNINSHCSPVHSSLHRSQRTPQDESGKQRTRKLKLRQVRKKGVRLPFFFIPAIRKQHLELGSRHALLVYSLLPQ